MHELSLCETKTDRSVPAPRLMDNDMKNMCPPVLGNLQTMSRQLCGKPILILQAMLRSRFGDDLSTTSFRSFIERASMVYCLSVHCSAKAPGLTHG